LMFCHNPESVPIAPKIFWGKKQKVIDNLT